MKKIIIEKQVRGLSVQHGSQYVLCRDKWDVLHEVGQMLDLHEKTSVKPKSPESTQ